MVSVLVCEVTGCQLVSVSHIKNLTALTFPPVVPDWVMKDHDRSSHVCATGHIKDPVPLVEKSRVSCPGGGCPPSFIHHWTEDLNMFSP